MKRWLRAYPLLASLLLLYVAACSSTAAQPAAKPGGAQPAQAAGPLPVKFGWQLQTDWSFFAARGAKLFEEAGLAPEYVQFPAGREMLAALQSKSIDVATASSVVFNVALAQGIDVQALYVVQDSSRNDGLVARGGSGIRGVADLVGKKVGYTKGSAAHLGLSRALTNAGLSPERLTLVDLAPDKAFAAFTVGDLDAWWVWQPWLAKAEAEGGEPVTTDKDNGVTNLGVWYARTDWVRDNPEAAKRVARTAALAAERLQQDRSLGTRAVAQALSIPEEMAARIYEPDVLPTPQELLGETSPLSMTAPGGLARTLDDIGAFLYEQKIVPNRPEPAKAIDAGPLRAAEQASASPRS